MRLWKRPDSRIVYKGRRYKVNLRFDNVLKIFELQKERELSAVDKIVLTAELLIGRNKLSIKDKADIIEMVFKTAIASGGSSTTKPFDFVQDAGPIYASFWQAYKIDLHSAKLHWRQFMALFEGLPSDSAIKEIVNIRLKPVPEATKYNAAEIRALMEAKATYALKYDEEESQQNFQRDLDRFAQMVRGR